MTMIMHRSFADRMGFDWPRNVARVETDRFGRRRVVTWADVHAARGRWQAERLASIRGDGAAPRIVPCYVWTFYVPGWLYTGWWCYVVTLRDRIAVNFRYVDEALAVSIMTALPLGFLPVASNLAAWMPELARTHPRKRTARDPRKAGVVVGWLEDGRRVSLDHPGKRREERREEAAP